MPYDDFQADEDTNAGLQAIADCLRWALADVEAIIASGDTPLTKIDRVGETLEALGDRLDRVAGGAP